jgi:hypothetical protein
MPVKPSDFEVKVVTKVVTFVRSRNKVTEEFGSGHIPTENSEYG